MTKGLGGGLKTRISDNVELRTDVRWFRFTGRGRGTDEFRVAQGISFNVGKR